MLRIVSDLHIEGMKEYKLTKAEREEETILILAGDICEFPLIETHPQNAYYEFLKDCNKRFRKVLYVPGNHEYYGTRLGAYPKWKNIIEQEFDKIKLLNNDTEIVTMDVAGKKDDTNAGSNLQTEFTIAGSTLWTDINGGDPMAIYDGGKFMGHEYIQIQGDFTPHTTIEENRKGREFLNAAIERANVNYDPLIIVTHHLPTHASVPPRFKSTSFNRNCMFANTGLESMFDHLPLRVWIHGHTHDSIDMLMGHNSRVICNPKGHTDLIGRVQNRNYDDCLTLSPEALYF